PRLLNPATRDGAPRPRALAHRTVTVRRTRRLMQVTRDGAPDGAAQRKGDATVHHARPPERTEPRGNRAAPSVSCLKAARGELSFMLGSTTSWRFQHLLPGSVLVMGCCWSIRKTTSARAARWALPRATLSCRS